jgi:pimeloyl-ACP methyl ester carboxylesterase
MSNPSTAEKSAKVRWSVPLEERFLHTADGQTIYATRRGTGDIAVVVAHGITGGHKHGSHARILGWLEKYFQVIAIDQRGHGQSSGTCTLSHLEVQDVDAAIDWAKEIGAKKVVLIGFSMGAASVVRTAALATLNNENKEFPLYDQGLVVKNIPDAVVTVGGVSHWWYRGSRNMRMMHLAVKYRFGQKFLEKSGRVRFGENTWPDERAIDRTIIQPLDPADSVTVIAKRPLLIIQGKHDDYFPRHHGDKLAERASQVQGSKSEYWFETEMGHAESAMTEVLIDRIAAWIKKSVDA